MSLLGFLFLHIFSKKWRKYDGQITFIYLVWYGVERFVVEGLRTDSLYLFHTGIRVSQVLGFASALAAIVFLVWMLAVRRPDPERLWVNRMAARSGDKKDAAPETDGGER